jgi:WASH complex subunit 7
MSKMEALNELNFEKAFKNADLLLQGVIFANEITNLYTILTNMSASLSKVMTKSSVLSLCHLVELLKAIQMTYHKKKEFLVFNVQLILQELVTRLLNYIQAARVN